MNYKRLYVDKKMSWHCSAGTAGGYGLDGRSSFPGKAGDFSLLQSVQTGSGGDPASYPLSTGAISHDKVVGA
jgi:hypothetical protein